MPMSQASVTIIEGQMGTGKTNTATAIAVDAYKANPKVKIFANYHLYGIPYVFCDASTMLEFLNTGLISDGYMIVDEAYITGDARQGTNPLAKIFTWMGQQMRKRNIEFIIIVQHGRFIDWRFRYIMTRKIQCQRFNPKTNEISLIIKDMITKKEKRITYWAARYWQYYDTNELPMIPEKSIGKAKEWAVIE
jgi:hypothetical protein